MGVYYDASIAWGLLIPRTEELSGYDLEDVYDLPEGFSYSMGGDLMSGTDEAYVLHPKGASQSILSTAGYEEGFGVHPISHIYNPSDFELNTLVDFASHNGIPANIGWFAISSVG